MLVGELHGKVGVAPGTTTIRIPGGGRPALLGQPDLPAMTEDEYRAADIAVRREETKVRRREVFWTGFAAFGTSTISTLVLVGVLAAFLRTGKLKTPTTT